MSANNDSNDLEALFDSIAADFTPAAPAPAPVAPKPAASTGDDDDLQALFDSVSAETQATQVSESESTEAIQASGEAWPAQEGVFNQIGQMARALHDTLGQLGYDK